MSKERKLDDHRKKSVIIIRYRGCYLHILHVVPIQFESLKGLLKEIAETEASDTNNLSKSIADIHIYEGPILDVSRHPCTIPRTGWSAIESP